MADTYNGWTNYATWRVNLEMLDGVSPSELCIFDTSDPHEVADALKELCEERIQEGTENDLALSYALAFMDGVNWREIAEHMIDAYADN